MPHEFLLSTLAWFDELLKKQQHSANHPRCVYPYPLELESGSACTLTFTRKREKVERLWRSDAYLRLRFSRYTEAARAENAMTATPLNSGTGMLLCSR